MVILLSGMKFEVVLLARGNTDPSALGWILEKLDWNAKFSALIPV
jgi:hypothetical protein